MDSEKLKYYTTAAWLRGFSRLFDEDDENSKAILYKLTLASKLLDAVWDEYAKEQGL